MQLFEKGTADGDLLVWDSILGRYKARPRGAVEVVTSLPTGPFPGQEIILVDSISSPTFHWHLRYNDLSVSSYKWEFIGGSPLFAQVTGGQGGTNSTYANVTGGPSVSLPSGVGGDFYVTLAGSIAVRVDVDNTGNALLSYTVGAIAASDSWAAFANLRIPPGAGGTSYYQVGVSGISEYRHAAVAAAAAFTVQARRDTGATDWIIVNNRSISIIPQRVG